MTPLALLAPDQRAVLELVLRQERSYGELSELLGIPEREVRDRAESALGALAGDPADPAVDTGRIADWLLGQQTERAATATAERVGSSEPARAWAAAVAERLREVGGERVPDVPGAGGRAEAGAATGERPAPRPRPLRETAPPARPPAAAASPARASKTGGAILIGVVVLVLVALLVWPVNLLGLGSDESEPPSTASAQPTATATPGSIASQATGNDIVLTGTGASASKAEGLMRLFKSDAGAVQFAIGAQGVPNNAKKESYAVWFTGKGKAPRLLGFPQTQVTNGVLTVGGPTKADEKKFPAWFATYDRVLITRETKARPAQPGATVLQGTLPHGRASG